MNVEAGDLAVIVGSDEGKADGGMVKVERRVWHHPDSDLPHWHCRTISTVRNVVPLTQGYDVQPIPPGREIICPDSILRPIKGDGSEKDERKELPAPKLDDLIDNMHLVN